MYPDKLKSSNVLTLQFIFFGRTLQQARPTRKLLSVAHNTRGKRDDVQSEVAEGGVGGKVKTKMRFTTTEPSEAMSLVELVAPARRAALISR